MLNRENFNKYVTEAYGVASEFPWVQYPGFAVFLDGSVEDEKLKWLLDISYMLTKGK